MTAKKKKKKAFPKEAKKGREGAGKCVLQILRPPGKEKNYCKIEIERVKRCGSSMVKACFYLFIYLLAAGGLCGCLNIFFEARAEHS